MTDLGLTHVWRDGTAEDARTLLLLHGTGGDENDLLPLADMLAPGAAVLSPRGRVVEQGMPRWFRRVAPGVFDEADLRVRTSELAEFVGRAAEFYRFDPAKMTAVGFSNGANIAATMLLLGCPVPLQAILIRAMVPLVPTQLPKLAGRRVLILAGKVDPMSPPDQPKKLVQMLRGAGADATLVFNEAGHELTPFDVSTAQEFLAV